jgi:hypothetical protein
MGKPELPGSVDWPQDTQGWFDVWQQSPRTDGWDAAQWQYMFDTALVHSMVWGEANYAMLGELRQRLAYLGLTFEPPKAQPVIADPEKVTPLEEIRRRREQRGTAPRRSATAP